VTDNGLVGSTQVGPPAIYRVATGAVPPLVLTNLVITPSNPVIGAGTNQQFSATGYFSDGASRALTLADGLGWRSGDEAVATIAASGLATGLGAGTAEIEVAVAGLRSSTVLTVVVQPTIAKQPVNVTAAPNEAVTLSVTASGGALSYQWQLNGVNIPGATSPTLSLTGLNPSQAGVYTVIISNVAGTATSKSAAVSLLSLNVYAGLTIVGQVGSTYQIDYCNALDTNNWTTLTQLVLPGSPYLFIDPDSPNRVQRFYRAVLLP
jgi:hypothetical protein